MGSMFDEFQVAESNSVIRIASAVALAILYYDYALTLSTEVERFWQRPCSRALTISTVAWRYSDTSPCSMSSIAPTRNPCSTLQMYHQMLVGVMQVVVAALQIYRLYALYESSRRILYSLLALAGVACAISGWAISQTWHTQTHARTLARPVTMKAICDLRMSAREGKHLAIIWMTVLLCDTVFFALIVNRVVRRQRWRGGLFTLLLRDGAAYFGAMLVCHLANILTCLIASPPFRGVSVTITNALATTLIARVMLNLRDPALTSGSCWWGASDTETSTDDTGLW